ncbi:MAG: VTT domain-containing protein [Puniceicoccaceae bacterium]
MKHYGMIAACIVLFVIAGFVGVQWMGVEWLNDPSSTMQQGAGWAALIGGGLLLADVFIPVPSSVVMMAHGAMLGVGVGFLVSWVASIGGAMLGWWIGRYCKAWVSRHIAQAEQDRVLQLFEQYGLLAIVISRMLPILSETVSIMAGLVGMGWKRVMIASALGAFPPALIYAIAGALSVNAVHGAWIAGAVFAIAGLSWWISKRLCQTRSMGSGRV